MPEPLETALVVNVPVADPLVGELRLRLDAAARWGVPAHVTVLFPFLDLAQIDDPVLAVLSAVVARIPRFEATWRTTAWFDQTVLWLAPEPAEPFRALTQAVVRAFPSYPPFGGQHPEVIPHLTVGNGAPLQQLQAAEREVATKLPFSMPVTHVQLLAGSKATDSWKAIAEFPLGESESGTNLT